MKNIVIFSGTSEGKRLAEELAVEGISSLVCVASDYGKEVMEASPLIGVHVGRLDLPAMIDFLKAKAAELVVDATHPFATEVSANIKKACGQVGIPCLRLLREEVEVDYGDFVSLFDSQEECARALARTEGRILLTTGSKEVGLYGALPDLRSRVFARVLPVEASIALCKEAGLADDQIIAAKGPFSKEENIRDIRDHNISILVTKESGKSGGLEEKLQAAAQMGIQVYMIKKPEESGFRFEEILNQIKDKG